MGSLWKQLKSIEQETQLTVFGYIRQNQNKLSLFCNVPDGISYLCLSYYYFHGEYFEKAGNDIQISNDEMTVAKVVDHTDWNNTSYGKRWIDSAIPQIIEWKFKINKISDLDDSICFCLVSCDSRINADCNAFYDAPNFGFCNTGAVIKKDPDAEIVRISDRFESHQGDIISMTLDTKSGKLYFQKNDEERLCYVENVSCCTYKMAISLKHKLNSVSLVDFKCNLI